jgi:hypothetical protein
MIDEFGLYSKEEPFDPMSVMLFKALQVVSFLFFLALERNPIILYRPHIHKI